MSYSIEKLEGEPIIINRWEVDFDDKVELPLVVKEIRELLDKATEPTHLISDRTVYKPTVETGSAGAQAAGRGPNPLFHHPNIGKIAFVTTDKITELIAKGMKSNTYGAVHIEICETMEDALAYVRTQD